MATSALAGSWFTAASVDVVAAPAFEMQFRCEDVDALAARFGADDVEAFRTAGEAVRRRGYYTRQEFIRVCAWKTVRSRPKIASNTAGAIREATRQALASQDEKIRIGALLELNGVGVPTASTLLYCAFPDDYPILDVRALDSLGVKPRSTYPVSFWLAYLNACRDIAIRCGVSIRTLDKALWQFSKERSMSRAGRAARSPIA